MNRADLQRLRDLLASFDLSTAEKDLVDAAMIELEGAIARSKPTAQTLFGQHQPQPVVDLALRLVLPFVPLSMKNTQALGVVPCAPRGKQRIPWRPIRYVTHEARAQIEDIQARAVRALRVQAPHAFEQQRPLLVDEDARVEMVHNVRNETYDVLIRHAGAKPKGFTGRGRDVHNMPELVCDALQGIAYRNDNQVVDLRVWRNAGDPTTNGETL